ncbi:MAG: MCE family protein [Phycisphaeraceae bacterium]|nr:MAG: MCE family protein [Phycisphaeraceae bacterium]
MSEKAHYFKLGLFVTISSFLLLAVLAALGAGAFLQRTIRVETYMDESVQGLDVGAPVRHLGVTVGSVSAIKFISDRYEIHAGDDFDLARMSRNVLIEMRLSHVIDPKGDSISALERAIENGLRARLGTANLMGTAFIELVFADPVSAPPMAITWTPENLYLPSTRSVLGQFTDTVTRIAHEIEQADVQEMISRAGNLMKSLDEGVQGLNIKAIEDSALAMIDELRDSNRRVREILDSPAIDSTLEDLAAGAEVIRRLTGGSEQDLESFIADLPRISDRMRAAVEQIDDILADEQTTKLLADLSRTAESAAPAASELRRLARRLDTLLAAQQQDIDTIMASLRTALESFSKLAEDASANPSRLLFGDPPPRTDMQPSGGGR